jgi:hypothetical protein
MISRTRFRTQSAGALGAAVALVLIATVAWAWRAGEPPAATADTDAAQGNASLAFLYAYEIDPGEDGAFFEGYKRHLDWHAQHGDSLSWLGWTVDTGNGLNLFVNGVFGVSGAAMDQRVEPDADGADAARNIAPHARAVYRHTYRVRRDLSRSARLEANRPAAMQHVAWITPSPGAGKALEDALRSLRDTGIALADYTVYERLAGGTLPGLLLVVQYESWAEVAATDANPVLVLQGLAGSSISDVASEIWGFRPDLTYIPKDE